MNILCKLGIHSPSTWIWFGYEDEIPECDWCREKLKTKSMWDNKYIKEETQEEREYREHLEHYQDVL